VSAFAAACAARFGDRARAEAPLAPFTTLRVGGVAEVLLDAHGEGEVIDALQLAAAHGVAVTLLGGGSNALVSDAGIRGLVLRCRRGAIRAEDDGVRAEAAATINGLVRHCIGHGLAGLEAWAGTPGNVGGGICGNAHFQGRLLSEHVISVRLASRDGACVVEVPTAAMDFGYDRSRVQRSGEVVISALFRVVPGEPEALRETARASLAFRKRTQPLHLPSAGCFFQNPDPARDPLPPGMLASAGALIDRAGMKGARLGGAQVSTAHANFLVNTGGATAADFDRLARSCVERVQELFGVRLREEIARLGPWPQGKP
jgi:UDP-N-acetylmuramate dehydrogenase